MIREGDTPCIICNRYTIIGINRSAFTGTGSEGVAGKDNVSFVPCKGHTCVGSTNGTTVQTTLISLERDVALVTVNIDATSCVYSTTISIAYIIFENDIMCIIAEGHTIAGVNCCTTPAFILIIDKSNAAVIEHNNISGMDGSAILGFVDANVDI